MNEHEVLEELRMADPAPTGAERPAGTWSSSVVLQTIERRSGTMQTINKTKPVTPKPGRRRRLVAAAAALVVAVTAAAVTVAVIGGGDEPDVASLSANVTFTGDACSYEGPAEFALQDRVTFTFRNLTGDTGWALELTSMPEGTTAADIAERGSIAIAVEQRGDLSGALGGISGPTTAAPESLTRTMTLAGPVAVICVSHPDRDTEIAEFFRVTEG